MDFLQKQDRAGQELYAAEVALRGNFPPGKNTAALSQLGRGRQAWREMQTQVFRLSLLFESGAYAFAVRDAGAIVILYSRWLQALGDLAEGRTNASTTERIAAAYSGYAGEYNNEFTKHANQAIRPSFATSLSRRRHHERRDDFETHLAELDEYAEFERASSAPIKTMVDADRTDS